MLIKRYFILYGGYKEQVIRGQVIEHLSECKSRGMDLKVIFLNYGGSGTAAMTVKKMSKLGLDYKILPFARPWNLLKSISDSWKVSRFIKQDAGKDTSVIIHARGEAGAVAGAVVKFFLRQKRVDTKLIFDWRGDVWAERCFLYEHKKSGFRDKAAMLLKIIDVKLKRKLIFTFSDRCIAVSGALVEKSRVKNTYWMPGYASQNLFYYDKDIRGFERQRMGVSDKLVFCYSGSIKDYQEPKMMISLVRRVKQYTPNVSFLIITQDLEKTEELLRKNEDLRKNTLVCHADHKDVNNILNAADIGLLIRRPGEINRCSFPTKFLEYIYAGLPVITTEAVPDISGYIRASNCGTVVNFDLLPYGIDKCEVQRLLSLDKAIVSSRAKNDFSDDKRFDIYKRLYSA